MCQSEKLCRNTDHNYAIDETHCAKYIAHFFKFLVAILCTRKIASEGNFYNQKNSEASYQYTIIIAWQSLPELRHGDMQPNAEHSHSY